MSGPASTREIRTFSLGLTVILAAMAGLFWWRDHPAGAGTTLSLGVISLILGLAWPRAMRPVHRAMTLAGLGLGWLNTRLLLGIMFYLVFTPVSLVLKLLGRDPLRRQADPAATSYWVPKATETRGPERYEKMF